MVSPAMTQIYGNVPRGTGGTGGGMPGFGKIITSGIGMGLSALGAGLRGRKEDERFQDKMAWEKELEEQRKEEAERSQNMNALAYLQQVRGGMPQGRLGFRDALAQSIFRS